MKKQCWMEVFIFIILHALVFGCFNKTIYCAFQFLFPSRWFTAPYLCQSPCCCQHLRWPGEGVKCHAPAPTHVESPDKEDFYHESVTCAEIYTISSNLRCPGRMGFWCRDIIPLLASYLKRWSYSLNCFSIFFHARWSTTVHTDTHACTHTLTSLPLCELISHKHFAVMSMTQALILLHDSLWSFKRNLPTQLFWENIKSCVAIDIGVCVSVCVCLCVCMCVTRFKADI